MESLQTKIITPPDSIEAAKAVRKNVFQQEQGIGSELDFDGNDEAATHIVVYHEDIPVGTGRMRKIDATTVKIERVAVIAAMRKKGIGKLIMQAMDQHLLTTGIARVTLDAQSHAKGFYENLGYRQEGKEFDEVGIPHVVMIKRYQ
jgi:predicted GNAT family N-acyltransferase